MVDFLRSIPDHRTVLFDAPPTAEHLSLTALRILEQAFAGAYGKRIRVELQCLAALIAESMKSDQC